MIRKLVLVALTAIASALPVAGANAQEVTLITSDQTIEGSIAGNTGGTFRKFEVEYPGGSGVQVIFDVNDARSTMGNLLGFEIYGPTGLVARGQPPNGDRTARQARAAFSQPTPARYLIQVYSYVSGQPTNYSLKIAGLEGGPSLAGSSNPESAPLIQSGNALLAGSLRGNTGGAALHYLVAYAGGDIPMEATLISTPLFAGSGQAVRLQLYDGDNLMRESLEVERTSTTSTHRLSYSNTGAANLGLQIVNYGPNHLINYSLEVTGLGAEPIRAEENMTPERAFVLTAETPSIVGTIQGNRGGSFVYFLLTSPGDREIRIAVTTARDDRAIAANVGINRYFGATLEKQALSSRDGGGRLGSNLVIPAEGQKTYGIQVFNYNPIPLEYSLNMVGLP